MQQPDRYAGPPVPVRLSLAALYAAWRRARRAKRPSDNRLAFEARWLDGLHALHQQLRSGTSVPRRTVSFVVRRPKTREIHAPDFADRIVHHWLVGWLERLYEPVFIHDSWANRAGKGTHAAVDRLAQFIRQRNGRGWFLQLKAESRLAPLSQGIDFLGYVLLPSHRLVRRRVLAHCRAFLQLWAQQHVTRAVLGVTGTAAIRIHAKPPALRALQHRLASWWGHVRHAHSWRWRRALFARFNWLYALFSMHPESGVLSPRWVAEGAALAAQIEWLRRAWPNAVCEVQQGADRLRFGPLGVHDGSRVRAVQTGWLHHGARRREIDDWLLPARP